MGVEIQPVLSEDDLNRTDREVLDLLREGRVTPPYVRDELDKSREYASERLIRLNEHGHARRLAPGLYELVDDPRDDVEPTPDVATLQARIDELEDALANGGMDIDVAIRRLREAAGVADDE